MTHDQLLLNRVGAFRTRIRLLVTQQWVCVGLTFAMLASLLLVAATKLHWWTDAIDYLWAMLLVGAITGLIIGATRKITPMVAAQIADERGGLKERLSTAVEIASIRERSAIAQAQLADAAHHAGSLQVSRVLPWKPPRGWRPMAGAMALLLAVIYVPELPIFHTRQERMDRVAMQKEGQRIQKIAKEIEKKLPKKKSTDENEEIVRRIAAEMKKLGKDEARGRVPKKQAMLKMNELQKTLKEAEQKVGGGQNAKAMEQVVSQLQQAADKQSQQGGNEQAKALKQMADNLSKRDFDAAKKQLEDMAKKMQSGQMSPEEAGKAGEMLQQMAESMQGSSLDKASQEMKDAAKQLEKAAQSAREFQKQMANAKTDAERQKLQQQMSQQMSQAGQQAGQQTGKACSSCKAGGKNQESADKLGQMSQALQSAQQSLQNAGQQSAKNDQESSDEEMGQEMGQGQQSGQGQKSGQGQGKGQGQGQSGSQSGSSQGGRGGKGPGLGNPGQGVGGNVGPQQPLPGVKKDELVRGAVNPKGQHMTRSYMGTPDPTRDKAAYYQVVPERVRAAEASLNREEIPAGHRDQVRRYFESISPGGGK